MSGIIHQKQDPNAIRATGTLEKRSPGDQAVQVLLYVLIALICSALCCCPLSTSSPVPSPPSRN